MQQMQPVGVVRCERGAAGDRGFVTIEGPDMALGVLENCPRVAATAKSTVEIYCPIARPQRFQHFCQHYWDVGSNDLAVGAVRRVAGRHAVTSRWRAIRAR